MNQLGIGIGIGIEIQKTNYLLDQAIMRRQANRKKMHRCSQQIRKRYETASDHPEIKLEADNNKKPQSQLQQACSHQTRVSYQQFLIGLNKLKNNSFVVQPGRFSTYNKLKKQYTPKPQRSHTQALNDKSQIIGHKMHESYRCLTTSSKKKRPSKQNDQQQRYSLREINTNGFSKFKVKALPQIKKTKNKQNQRPAEYCRPWSRNQRNQLQESIIEKF